MCKPVCKCMPMGHRGQRRMPGVLLCPETGLLLNLRLDWQTANTRDPSGSVSCRAGVASVGFQSEGWRTESRFSRSHSKTPTLNHTLSLNRSTLRCVFRLQGIGIYIWLCKSNVPFEYRA